MDLMEITSDATLLQAMPFCEGFIDGLQMQSKHRSVSKHEGIFLKCVWICKILSINVYKYIFLCQTLHYTKQ